MQCILKQMTLVYSRVVSHQFSSLILSSLVWEICLVPLGTCISYLKWNVIGPELSQFIHHYALVFVNYFTLHGMRNRTNL